MIDTFPPELKQEPHQLAFSQVDVHAPMSHSRRQVRTLKYVGAFSQPKVVNLTGLLQLVKNLLQTCEFDQVVYNKSVKIRLVATCRLQICYNLLKQLAASLWITGFQTINLQQVC